MAAYGDDVKRAKDFMERLHSASPALLKGCKAALAALDSPEAQHVRSFTLLREEIRAIVAKVEGVK